MWLKLVQCLRILENKITEINNISQRKQKFVVISVLILALILFSFLKLFQHYTLQTSTLDLGYYANVSWNIFHGNGFRDFAYNNSLGDHFSPIHIFTGILLYIWMDAAVLLIFQCVCIVSGGLAVYLLAKHIFKSWFISFLFILFYFSNAYLNRVNAFDYHPIAIAVPVFLWILYFMDKKQWICFYILIILSLSIQEIIPIGIFGIAVFMCFNKSLWKRGIILMIASVVIFIVEMKFIIPYFWGAEKLTHISRYSDLGNSFGEVASNIIFKPYLVIKITLLNFSKLGYLIKLFATFGFLPLFSGIYIIPSVLPILSNFLSSYSPQYKYIAQYSAIALPFMIYAALYGLLHIRAFLQRMKTPYINLTLIIIILVSVIHSIAVMPKYFSVNKDTSHIREFFKACRIFKQNDSICVQNNLFPHLAFRDDITLYGLEKVEENMIIHNREPQYYIFDTKLSPWPFKDRDDFNKSIAEILSGNKYGVVQFQNDILVLGKGYGTDRNQETLNFVNGK